MFEEGAPQPKGSRAGGGAGRFDLSPLSLSMVALLEPQDPADAALTALELAHRRLLRDEARQVAALVSAHEACMTDLAERFGTASDDRSGLPGKAFLKQAAAILHCTEWTASRMLHTALDLRESFPLTWAALQEGRVPWRAAGLVVQQSLGLDPDLLPAFDEVAVEIAEHGTAGRMADRLRRARERLQADTAVARAAVTRSLRRVDLDPLPDGEAALTIRGPAVELVAFDQALLKAAIAAREHAKAAGEPDVPGIGAYRFDIALDLLLEGVKQQAHPDCAPAVEGGETFPVRVPQRRGVVPTVALTMPALAWLGRTTEQAILAGYGPIDLDTARELCAEAPSILRVLTDPVTGVRIAMDRKVYTPPPDLKRWLRIRDELCGGLGCRRPADQCDIDHVTEWHEDGKTEEANLRHECRRCHLIKSSGMWTNTLNADATVSWTSPWGRTYISDPVEQSDPAPVELLPTGDGDDCPF